MNDGGLRMLFASLFAQAALVGAVDRQMRERAALAPRYRTDPGVRSTERPPETAAHALPSRHAGTREVLRRLRQMERQAAKRAKAAALPSVDAMLEDTELVIVKGPHWKRLLGGLIAAELSA